MAVPYSKSDKYFDLNIIYNECSDPGGLQLAEFMESKMNLSRRADIQGRFTIPCAQEIAQVRFERMDQCQRWLEEESFGTL